VTDVVQRECEEMKFKDKIKPLDDLFTSFFMFAPIVPIMVVAFGLDHRLLWFPYFMFLAWVVYIYWYRAKYVLQDYDELAMVERVRGLTYFFCLIVTLLFNSYVVFFPTPENRILTIVSVGFILGAIELIVPLAFFSRQTELFNKEQKKTLYKTLALASAVSIYYSMMIASVNQVLFESFFVNPNLPAMIILSLMIFVVGIVFAYPREKGSRRYAEKLAASLEETEWKKQYTTTKERKRRKIEIEKKRRLKRQKK